jgi:hypothetical protein
MRQAFLRLMVMSFKEFPPRQKPASFNLDQVLEGFTAGGHGN